MVLHQRDSERLMSLKREEESAAAFALGFSVEKLNEFRTVFDGLDEDGSRALDISELRYAMKLLGKQVTSEELRGLFASIDKDGSGQLDFCEFLELMKMVEDQRGLFNKEPEKAKTVGDLDELHVRECLEFFPLSKDYVRSLPVEQMVETLCSYMKVGPNDDLQEALTITFVDEFTEKCREAAEKVS